MALIFIEGFEHGVLSASGYITGVAAVGTIETAGVRSGSGARYLDLQDNNARWKSFSHPWDASTDTIFVGFAAVHRGTLSTQAFASVGGYPTNDEINDSWITLNTGSDGVVHCTIGANPNSAGTQLFESSAGAVVTETWHYYEIEWLCHESTGHAEVWIDGVSIGSFDGDTQAEATAANKPDLVVVGFRTHSTTLHSEFDDLYILDDTTTSPQGGTSPNIGRLGNMYIEAIVPDSDAVPNDFTRSAGANNWELVDEIPPDDDTTYNHSSTSTDEDRYGLANMTLTGTVVGVQLYTGVTKNGGNQLQTDLGLVSNSGATVDATTSTLTEDTYKSFTKTYDRDFHDGVTAADWTTAKVDALETSIVVL